MSRSRSLLLGLFLAIALAAAWLALPNSDDTGEGALGPEPVGTRTMVTEEIALAPDLEPRPNPDQEQRVQAGSVGGTEPLGPDPEERTRREAAGWLVLVLEDPEGQPVEGVTLAAYWRKGWGDYGEDVGTTDERGRFPTTIEGPWMVEDVKVRENGPARSLEHLGPFDPDPDRPHEVLLRLPREGLLQGTVRDTNGEGIADIEVVAELMLVLREPFEHRLSRAGAETRSAADGSWSLVVPLGTYLVALSDASNTWSPGHEALVRLDGQQPELEVPLQLLSTRGAELTVTVHSPPGSSAEPSIRATAKALDGPTTTAVEGIELLPLDQVRLGERQVDGSFVVQGLTPGKWMLRGRADGCRPLDVSIPRFATRMEVTLLPTLPERERAVVRGVLLGADGSPIQGQVLMISDWRTSGESSGDRTDPQGRFEVALGARGKYLRAQAPGHCWTTVGPLNRAALPDLLEIRLEPLRDIHGTVVDESGRAAMATVVMRRGGTSVRSVVPSATEPAFLDDALAEDRIGTGPDGAFRFLGIPEGPHELWAYPENRALPPGRAVVRGGETDVQLILGANLEDTVTIRGRVHDALSGDPLPGVAVYARPAEGTLSMGGSGLSDEEGRFSLIGHPPGQLGLWVEPPAETARHHAFLTVPPESFSAGEHERDLALHPARTLHLSVVAADGSPLWGVEINVLDAVGVEVGLQDANGRNDGSSAHSDANGRVDLRGLPAAKITLLALRQREDDYRHGRPNYRLLEEDEEQEAIAFEIDLTHSVPELKELVLPW